MSADYSVGFLWLGDAVKMTFKAFFNSVFGLAHILGRAKFAGDAINQIIAVASDVMFTFMCLTSGGANYLSGLVQFWAIATVFS